MPDTFPLLNPNTHAEVYHYLERLLFTAVHTPLYRYRNYYDWSLDIIHDDSSAHAFTLPGGHLFLTTGLLRYLADVSEALALIAHELHYADTDEAFAHLREAVGGLLLGDIVLGNEVGRLSEAALEAS